MSEHLTPKTRAEWRKDAKKMPSYPGGAAGRTLALLDALDKAERERDNASVCGEQVAELLAEVERERNEAREALARVKALRDEWERTSRRPCNHGASAAELRAALAGPNPTDTEGDDR